MTRTSTFASLADLKNTVKYYEQDYLFGNTYLADIDGHYGCRKSVEVIVIASMKSGYRDILVQDAVWGHEFHVINIDDLKRCEDGKLIKIEVYVDEDYYPELPDS
jgi:hypothetical protein